MPGCLSAYAWWFSRGETVETKWLRASNLASTLGHCKGNSEVGYQSIGLLIVWWSAYNGDITECAALWDRLWNKKGSLIWRVGHHERQLEVCWENIVGCHLGNRLNLIEAREARSLIERSLQNSELHLHDQSGHDFISHFQVLNSGIKILQLVDPLSWYLTIAYVNECV